MKRKKIEETDSERIVKRLNVLIALQVEQQIPEGHGSFANRVDTLYRAGLRSGDIADILGKPSNEVASAIGRRRKGKKRRWRSGNT